MKFTNKMKYYKTVPWYNIDYDSDVGIQINSHSFTVGIDINMRSTSYATHGEISGTYIERGRQ